MMVSSAISDTYLHDAFISYSRKDREFACRLEKALEGYAPPKGLKVPRRRLNIFRDEADFTGVEYHQSLDKYLKASAKLIVLCSPNARRSPYVDEEIRRFVNIRGPEHILPILIAGLPNNEATVLGQEEEKAFPQALCDVMDMPLAVSYVGFNQTKDKINKGLFYGSWYTVLANLYGVSRSEIEQREKKRKERIQRLWIGGVSVGTAVLTTLTIWALISRQHAIEEKREADQQRQIAEERRKETKRQQQLALGRQLIAQAELARYQHASSLPLSMLLAVEGMQRAPSIVAYQTLRQGLALLPRRVALLSNDRYVSAVAFSPDGRYLATASDDSILLVTEVPGGREVARMNFEARVRAVVFSPDGNYLVAGGQSKLDSNNVGVYEVTSGLQVATVAHKGIVVDIKFSPNGRYIATASRAVSSLQLDLKASFSFIQSDESAVVWEAKSGKRIARMAQNGGVNAVSFSPTGEYLATAGNDRTARLWKVKSGQEIARMKHEDVVIDVVFSADGKQLATASGQASTDLGDIRNNTTRIWQVGSGRRSLI